MLLLTALLYAWGDPALRGYRPALLEPPLRELHRAVRQSPSEIREMLLRLADLRSMHPLQPLLAAL
jgi:hypothetical protein